MIEYALRALQFVLAAGGFVMVYLTISPLVGANAREVALPAPEQGVSAPDTALPRYQIISERNLFRVVEPVEPAPDAPLQESRLPLQLTGTTVSDNPALSTAIVQAGPRSARGMQVVRVGDKLQTAEVVRIEPRRLVVMNEGKLEAVSLDDDDKAGPPSQQAIRRLARERENEPAPPAASDMQPRPPTQEEIDKIRSTLEEQTNLSGALQQLVRDFYRQARFTPSLSPEGNLDGLRVTRVTRGSDLAAAGLLAGDRIQAINGYGVAAIGSNPTLLQSMQQGSITAEVVGVDGTIRTVVMPQMPR